MKRPDIPRSRLLVHREPKEWRQRAEWARLAATHLPDVADREHQLKLAESYERFARFAEERLALDLRRNLENLSNERRLPALHPMSEFDPTKPAVLHDMLDDVMVPWTGEHLEDFNRYARHGSDGLVEWDGRVFDGWGEAPGG